MPIPRKLLESAFLALPEETLRKVAEHCEIRGREQATHAELASKLARNESNMLSFTSHFKAKDLRTIAHVFAIPDPPKSKDDLDVAVWGFINDYDEVQRPLSYDEVFGRTTGKAFAPNLETWLTSRHAVKRFKDLTKGEQTLWSVRYALMKIDSDGVASVFESGSDVEPEIFSQSLAQIGATKCVRAFAKIARLLFDDTVPPLLKDRKRIVNKRRSKEKEAFESIANQCDEIWDRAADELHGKMSRYASKNPGLLK